MSMDIINDTLPSIDIELYTLLQEEFNNEDQKQFIMNFQLYLIHGNDPTKFVVDLDTVWKCLGFSQKGTAKRLIQKTFEKNSDYVVQNLLYSSRKHFHGGNNKETILMNVSAFKCLTMISNTEKGKQTRLYYSKMETIFFKYLENKNKTLIETIQTESKKKLELSKQINLLDAYKDTPCVYIIKVSTENDTNFIIRMGETDNIENRIISHRQNFKDCILIDIFPCNRPHKFEQYLLNRPDIKKHRLPTSELINISDLFTYSTLINIINKNIDYYDNTPFDKKLEFVNVKFQDTLSKERVELFKLISAEKNEIIKQKFIDMLDLTYKNINTNELENKATNIDDENENNTDKIPDSNRRVYQYNIKDLHIPIATYFSLREAARSLNDVKIHDYHIRSACIDNTILNNYRWIYADKETNINFDVQPTQISETNYKPQLITKRKGLVAQINNEQNKIINVYPNQAIAANIMKIAACTITIVLKNKKQASGFYWEMYDNCSDELKLTFNGDIPEAILSSTSSKGVQKIDPETNNVIETYSCIQDVCNLYLTCHKTIKKISNSGDIYKGFIWKIK